MEELNFNSNGGSPNLSLNREQTASFAKITPNKKEILTITIEISDDKEGKIIAYEGDQPYDLAKKFCLQYNLTEDVIPKLEEEITKNMQSVYTENNTQKRDTNTTNFEEYIESPKFSAIKENVSNRPSSKSEVRNHAEYNHWKKDIESKMKEHMTNMNVPSISKVSRDIMSAKHRNQNVYDRLHEEALIKQKNKKKMNASLMDRMNEKTGEISCEANQKGSINYGLLLYEKGLRLKEEVDRKMQMEKKKREEKEIQEMTPKPCINANKKYNVVRTGKLEDEFLKNWKEVKEKKEKEKAKYFIKEQNVCTFHPTINRESQKIAQEKNKQMSSKVNNSFTKYDYLYEEAKMRQTHQNNANPKDTECTFKPNIIPTKHYQSKPVYKRKTCESESQMKRDEKTGQELFKPKIGRAPKIERNNAKLPIGDYLYNQIGVKEEESKKAKDDAIKRNQDTYKLSTNDKSNELHYKLKSQVFDELFSCLDSDDDGLISTQKINLEGNAIT